MFGIGATELLIILIIIIIIFGVGKLPEIGSGFGKAIKNFKKATTESEIDITPEKEEKEKIEASKKTENTAKKEQQTTV